MNLENYSTWLVTWRFSVIREAPEIYNNYSMSPSWIWSDKITNERVARVGYNHFISNKGEWNNCFSKFSNRVLPPIFISTILQSGKFLNLAKYFAYDVKLRLLAHSRSFSANQKARNEIVGAENLLITDIRDFTNPFYVILRRKFSEWLLWSIESALGMRFAIWSLNLAIRDFASFKHCF